MIKLTKVKDLYTLRGNVTFQLQQSNRKRLKLYSKKGKLLAEISVTGLLTVYEGYSWDGCSPKYMLEFGNCYKMIGVSDGEYDPVTFLPQLYYASLVHDVLCQFFHTFRNNPPYTRLAIDKIFRNNMSSAGWLWKDVYYLAVRLYAKVRYKDG